jgi:hypothetical protein
MRETIKLAILAQAMINTSRAIPSRMSNGSLNSFRRCGSTPVAPDMIDSRTSRAASRAALH